MKEKKIAVFIPGRLESSRCPHKLIRAINNTNLWEVACNNISNLSDKYQIYALCNDAVLETIAKKFGIPIIKRSKKSCTIDGPMKEVYEDLKDIDCTHLAFLNPCFFFLNIKRIRELLELFEGVKEDYATTVKPFKSWLYDECGNLVTRLPPYGSTKHQEGYWEPAHIMHIFPKDKFFIDSKTLTDEEPTFLLFMEEGKELLDVDTEEDLKIVRSEVER